MSIAESLVEVTDPEGQTIYTIVHSPGTYKLAFWVNEQKTCLLSSMLEEGFNAEVGSSDVTISYIDPITTAEFNVTYSLEILTRDTYQQYVTLGIFTPNDSTTIDCSSSTSTTTTDNDDKSDLIEAIISVGGIESGAKDVVV